MKKTKIICTIGPASEKKSVLKKMISAGMNSARINLSHGTFEEYTKRIENIRKIKDIPIILDTKGPEIRIHTNQELNVNKGETLIVSFDKNDNYFFDYNFSNEINPGDELFIEDGLLRSKIIEKTKDKITIRFINSGIIKNAKGVNLPEAKLDLPILHEKDKEGIKFAIKNKIDFIALSFTRTKKDILTVREKLRNSNIGIIAKIENKQGLDNFDEILKEADGIMVARGDLGVELPSEKIPLIQKELIRKCYIKGKFVITATQMLQSMIDSATPTRAETSDVANAILDGTDTVMLSAETAIGSHPVLAVKEMARISREVENSVNVNMPLPGVLNTCQAISHSVFNLQKALEVNKIVVLTKSGYTAQLISGFRLDKEIIAITPSKRVMKKLDLYFGITPVVYSRLPEKDRVLHGAMFAFKNGLLNRNDIVLFTAGLYITGKPSTNLIEIHRISDLLEYECIVNNYCVDKKN
ncbi:pyruvate kinase [Candidatus Woesearchaeota archaeon]|nr:pyruvate kinase [Candidatus Woesearchaeota archaeon]